MASNRTNSLRDIPGMRPLGRDKLKAIADNLAKTTSRFPQLARQAARRTVVARTWSIR